MVDVLLWIVGIWVACTVLTGAGLTFISVREDGLWPQELEPRVLAYLILCTILWPAGALIIFVWLWEKKR